MKKKSYTTRKRNTRLLIILILIVFSFSLFKIGQSFASTENFSLTGAEISSKSDSATVNSFRSTSNTITNNITFHKVGDYVTYKLTITNGDDKAYTLKAITNKNNNENITYEYNNYEGTKISAGKSQSFEITAKYVKELGNSTERKKLLSTKFEFTFEDENGNESKTSIDVNGTSNPKTGDNIKTYIVISIVSFIMLIGLVKRNSNVQISKASSGKHSQGKHSKKKRNKSGIKFLALLLVVTILVPTVAKASSNPFTIKFESQFELNDKIVVSYTVDGREVKELINYGETGANLPEPSKPGYIFKGWEYEDGTPYDPNSPITDNTKLVPKFEKIESKITISVSDKDVETLSKTITVENELTNITSDKIQTQYSTDGGNTWKNYTGPIAINNDGDIQVRTVITEEGIVIGSASVKIDKIKTASDITISVSDENTKTDSKVVTIDTELNNITDDKVKTQYSLDNGTTWVDYENPITITENGTIKVRTIKNEDGTVIGSAEKTINNLNPRSEITVSASEKDPETNTKQVTIETKLHNIAEEDTKTQYSTDNGQTWNDYTGPVTVKDNGDVQVRVIVLDDGTVIGSDNISIDELNPKSELTIAVSDEDILTNSKQITIDTALHNILEENVKTQYSLDDGQTWKEYTGPIIIQDNGKILARTIKTDDNTVIGTAEKTINNLNPRSEITITVSDEDIETSSKQVTIETEEHNIDSDKTTTQYSLDNGQTWKEYTGPIIVRNEGEILVRVIDDENNVIGEESKTIDNILILNSTLADGYSFNLRLRALTGDYSPTVYNGNEYLIEFKKYEGEKDTSSMTYENIISVDGAATPVYAWLDNGTIYWWSEAQHVSLNDDSSEMFTGFIEATKIDLSGIDCSKGHNTRTMFYMCYKLTDFEYSGTLKTTCPEAMFSGCQKMKNVDVTRFDTSEATSLMGMFDTCYELESVDLSHLNTTNVRSLGGMFMDCRNLKEINLTGFNTENVTFMGGVFAGCNKLESLDLSGFDTSKTESMNNMFDGCSSLTSLNLSNFNTENVSSFSSMFLGCTGLTALDLSSFDSSLATDMYTMFNNCTNLETIYVSELFVTTNVYDSTMFENDTKLVGGEGTTYSGEHIRTDYARVDEPSNGKPGYFTFKTSNQYSKINIIVSDENTETLSKQVTIEKTLYNIDEANTRTQYSLDNGNTWNDYTESITITSNGNIKFRTLNNENAVIGEASKTIENIRGAISTFISGTDFNSRIKTLAANRSVGFVEYDTNIKAITKYQGTPNISEMTSQNIVSTGTSEKPIYVWFDNGTLYWWTEAQKLLLNYTSGSMFFRLSEVESIDLIAQLDTSNAGWMDRFISGCSKLEDLDLSNFDTKNVIHMEGMFASCSNLKTLNIGNFNTSNVIDMSSMFFFCSELKNLNLHNFNTSKVTDMSQMFMGCGKLENLTIDQFDTKNVTAMNSMFSRCKNLTVLDISSFNVEKVTTMMTMFSECTNLRNITFGTFNMSSGPDLTNMFCQCKSLTSLDLSMFNTYNVKNYNYMFSGCSGLTSIDLSSFDTRNATTMQQMFINCPNLKTIYASDDFVVDNITDSSGSAMFSGDTSLIGGAGTVYNVSRINHIYARIDDPENGKPGYFTQKP